MRQTLRRLARNPGFTLLTVLTLAIGIGANTAIFSVVNAVLLQLPPFDEADRLVVVYEEIPNVQEGAIPISAPDVLDFQRQSKTLEGISAYQQLEYELSGAGQPERLTAARVAHTLFPLLRIDPVLGRSFLEEEDQPGRNVVILSHGLWQRRFGGDDAIGQTLHLDREPFTVVGVMPPEFEFPLRSLGTPADLWVPLAFTERDLNSKADNFDYSVLARLRPEVSLQQANDEVHAIAQRIRETYPPSKRDQFELDAGVEPLGAVTVRETRTPMLLLLGAVGLVLLVACANVANLFLAQATARTKEMSLRLALGAGRGRIIRQLLAESLPLSLLGGALGLVVAGWGKQLLVNLAPVNLPRMSEIGADLRVLGFALALSLAVSVLFAILPAVTVSRINPNAALREGGLRTTSGKGSHRVRGALVVVEIALAFVLLTGAGLLLRSFARVMDADPGFEVESVLAMRVTLPGSSYDTREQTVGFFRETLAEIASIPGVEAAGAANDLPLRATWTKLIAVEGRENATDGLSTMKYSAVYGDYMRAFGIRLRKGRYFTEYDQKSTSRVIIVNETLASKYWPGEDPIGKRLKMGPADADIPWLAVVGVVGDVKNGPMDAAADPHAYEPMLQVPYALRSLGLGVRAKGDPAALTSAVLGRIAQVDPELAVGDLQPMEQVVSESVAPRRFLMLLLALFAATAVLLAAIGIYGVLARAVTERTHEIGIRVALGAQKAGVYGMILSHGLKLALLGVLIGLAGSLALTRALASQLYGVGATDLLTFTAAPILVALVALMACLIPAMRATRVDPLVALRYE
jgi:putative ABC transport system permease protein